MLEKRITKSKKELCICLDALYRHMLCDRCDEDVNAKILRIRDFRPNMSASFEFYRLKEHLDKLLESYNILVKEYNDTVNGYPVCVIASVTGRKNIEIFESDIHSDN